GSGAIALAFKHRCPAASVTATDASPAALAVAAANARRLRLPIEFVVGNWWLPLHGRRFDVVLSNPPYVAEGDPHLLALTHAPHAALTAGRDGLAALRTIVAGAPAHLNDDGWLLVEHGHDQADAVRLLLSDNGFADVSTLRDLAGQTRCSGGRLPG